MREYPYFTIELSRTFDNITQVSGNFTLIPNDQVGSIIISVANPLYDVPAPEALYRAIFTVCLYCLGVKTDHHPGSLGRTAWC